MVLASISSTSRERYLGSKKTKEENIGAEIKRSLGQDHVPAPNRRQSMVGAGYINPDVDTLRQLMIARASNPGESSVNL